MLSAFTARPIVTLKPRDKSKIESILAYGDRLLVGLNTGVLRIYRVNEVPEEESEGVNGGGNEAEGSATAAAAGEEDAAVKTTTTTEVKPTDLLREQEKFSRYKIEGLAIIKEANILISLSGGYVSIHDLAEFQLQMQLLQTRGATAFAVTSYVEKDSATGVPSIVSRLAVAVKRRLLLWTWRDMELEGEDPEKGEEIALVSTIKTITWANGRRLVAGLSASYVLVDVEEKNVVDIVGPGSIGGAGADGSAAGGGGGRLGGVGMAGMGYLGMGGMIPKPLATRLSEGQMFLAKDINTHFIDTDGASLGRRQIPWATAPEAVGYSYPYLLALQDPAKGTLEVRNPETLSLLQSISLPAANLLHISQPNISLAHAGKGFLVASERMIWRMAALDYDSQIDALVANGQLDEAISLLNMLEDALLSDKEGRLREIKMQKAQVLFDAKRYRASLDLFTEVSAPPERVIRLYPKLIAGDLSEVKEEVNEGEGEEKEEEEEEVETVPETQSQKPEYQSLTSRFLGGGGSRNEDVGSDTASVKGSIKGASKVEASSAASKLGKFSTLKRMNYLSFANEITAAEKDLKAAVRELQGFLADVRRRLQRFLNPDGTLKDPSTNGTPAPSQTPNSSSNASISHDLDVAMQNLLGISLDGDVDRGEKLRETARLVDTTLFRAHMFATPSLAGSLFRIANFCDPDVVMERLEESGRYNDLVDFLFGKKLHRQALERLAKFGQAGDEMKDGEGEGEEASEKVQEKEKGEDKDGDEADGSAPATAAASEAGNETSSSIIVVPPQLRGPDRTIRYLQSLSPEYIDLILEFSVWPLHAAPDLAMEEIFLADTENAETLPRQRVVSFMEGVGRPFAIKYLEHVTGELGDQTPELHAKLIGLYLEVLKEDGKDEETKEKLLSLLNESGQFSPSRVLEKLPADGMFGRSRLLKAKCADWMNTDPTFYEARAIVFSKMGQHRQALEIYVFKLEDPKKAEE